jgi:hypothetical protein
MQRLKLKQIKKEIAEEFQNDYDLDEVKAKLNKFQEEVKAQNTEYLVNKITDMGRNLYTVSFIKFNRIEGEEIDEQYKVNLEIEFSTSRRYRSTISLACLCSLGRSAGA